MPRTDVEIRSLLAATDVDVLPDATIVEDRGEYVVVRTPSSPHHYWGNFLMFRNPPQDGDRSRWETAYETEFGAERESLHCALCWDAPGEEGAARSEFVDVGYEAEDSVALVARPDELVEHPRAHREVTVRALDPDGDEQLWAGVADLQVASRDAGHTELEYREYVESRMRGRRERFRAGDGAWFVAMLGDEVAASCGIIVTHGRCRYQAVDTAEAHRRRGIASRLVYEAGRVAVDEFGADHLVIGADADYHALPLYESLGFVVRERSLAVCWWPGAPRAALHPEFGTRARPAE